MLQIYVVVVVVVNSRRVSVSDVVIREQKLMCNHIRVIVLACVPSISE